MGLFCRISFLLQGSFAKQTYNFKEPTNCSHPIRLVGSLKLQVCFAKEPYKTEYILEKRPMILRSLLIVANPQHFHWLWCVCLGIFCKRALQKRQHSAKDTYDFKEPRSVLIVATPYHVTESVLQCNTLQHRSVRLVRSLKSQVSFPEYSLFYRAFLRTISTLLQIIGLFSRIQSLLQGFLVSFIGLFIGLKERTNRSHPISVTMRVHRKLQVSFAEEPYKRDDILQKKPMILRSVLIVATPYHVTESRHNI